MDPIGIFADGLMWAAGLAAICIWIYGFCHLVSSWFADNTSQPGGYVLFEGGLRELFWPTIRASADKPLSPAAIHKRKFRRSLILFAGAWSVGVFAGALGTLFGGWEIH
jgi:hypothetical protein